MQFMAQQSGYRAQYPDAAVSIIRRGDVPVGSMIVAREPEAMVLVDIALLPEHRRKGTGRFLLEGLLAESSVAGLPLRLSVRRDNPAIKLYASVGFSVTAEDDVFVIMKAGCKETEHIP
jgi:ribosomal protein S18 acetylase RimI-like enzyme